MTDETRYIEYDKWKIKPHVADRLEDRAISWDDLRSALDNPLKVCGDTRVGRTQFHGRDFFAIVTETDWVVHTVILTGTKKENDAYWSARRMAIRSPVTTVETRTPPSGMRVPKKKKVEPYVAPVTSKHPLDNASPGARAAFDAALKKFRLTYRDINITKVTKTRVEWEPKPGVRICQTEHLVGPTSER